MWRSTERELGKGPLDQVELDDTNCLAVDNHPDGRSTTPLKQLDAGGVALKGARVPPGALVEQILARAGRSRSARPRPGRSVPNLRRISCGFSNRSLDGSRSKFRILKNHRAETCPKFRRLRCETPEFPRRRTGSWPLTFGKVGASGEILEIPMERPWWLAGQRGFRTAMCRIRQLSDGRTVGGIPFTRGPLAYLLRNRFYIGEVVFRGQICPAEHPPILDRDLFEAVQRNSPSSTMAIVRPRASREALLMGRIFDDRGNRMSPSHSRKGAARYGYYVSSALIQGQPQSAGSVARVPAAKIEAVVLDAVRRHIGHDAPIDNTELITTYVRRIEVRRTEIAISLLSEDHASEDEKDDPLVLTVPWSKTPHRRHRDVIAPEGSSRAQVLPIRSDTRVKLVTAIARGRQWLSEIEAGAATIDGIAAREACSKRHVNMTISLAFLAPSLVKAAVEGRLPHGIGVARLFDAPVAWSRQHQMLGLAH